jgi:predicted lipid-binding transport protein (Tim44 family)
MSRRLAPAIGIVLSLAVTGCATITRGSTQALTIDSAPLGATASLSNGERCTTPCTLKLKRKHPLTVEVCKAGYQPVVTQVLSQIAGAGAAGMAGNVLVGGLIGVGVDAATGATKDLTPNPLSVTLVAGEPGCVAPSFPGVPDGGQTPAEYAAQGKKKDKGSKAGKVEKAEAKQDEAKKAEAKQADVAETAAAAAPAAAGEG